MMQDDSIIWKPVVGYEGLYDVSNYGDVRSLPRFVCNGQDKRQKLLKGCMKHKSINTRVNYFYVQLYKNNKSKGCFIHRLVGLAFLSESHAEGLVINHKDGNSFNNHVSNLEWVTQRQNALHAREELGRYNRDPGKLWRGKTGLAHNRSKPVIATNIVTGEQRHYGSCSVAKNDGFRQAAISACCLGKKKTYAGYTWRFAQRDEIKEA